MYVCSPHSACAWPVTCTSKLSADLHMLLEIIELLQGILHGIGHSTGIELRHRNKNLCASCSKSRYLFLFRENFGKCTLTLDYFYCYNKKCMKHVCSLLPLHICSVTTLPCKTNTNATINVSLVFWIMQHLNKTSLCVPFVLK